MTLSFKMVRNLLVTDDRNPTESRNLKVDQNSTNSADFKHVWIQVFK